MSKPIISEKKIHCRHFHFCVFVLNFQITQSIRCHVKNGDKNTHTNTTFWNLFESLSQHIFITFNYVFVRASLKFCFFAYRTYLHYIDRWWHKHKSTTSWNFHQRTVKATVLWLWAYTYHCFDGWHYKVKATQSKNIFSEWVSKTEFVCVHESNKHCD